MAQSEKARLGGCAAEEPRMREVTWKPRRGGSARRERAGVGLLAVARKLRQGANVSGAGRGATKGRSRSEALNHQGTSRPVDVAKQQRNEAWGEKKQGGRSSEMGTGGALAQAARIATASY
eukprot:CAMPEP_0174828256 /NCGR_PEP_ID=MMETSP1114-20130205/1223_1 /TAXON_ID=312471 /ORGANISM="Neobodo designis, Strain CCAP 1951/1" /LENGTH=120 /DNA_ID=CAMNT_0016061969 /DNA_START=210 /DNA_END=571 /DNA_ORIENTATION=+